MSVTQESTGRQLYFFVRRPVLAAVISIVVVLLGTFALLGMPVARYPQITPPSVQVSATYPGATAEDVAQAVAAPIEQQLSGLDGLLYYRSSNSSNGVMNLQVYFDIGRDQDIAAVDVQNAITVAEPQLPEEVRRQGLVIKKAQTDILLVASITSADPRYDATYLANYAKLYVVDELKRLNGVGDATVFGGLDFAMTIRLDPDKMAQLGITVGDVRDAVQEQNATNPAGTLGREPSPQTTQLTLPVTTLGRLKTADQFADVIVRAREDGSFVRVRDIGTVELTSQNLDLVGRMNGRPTANILIYLRPGANQLQVKEAFVARMNELAKGFPPGVEVRLAWSRGISPKLPTIVADASGAFRVQVLVFHNDLIGPRDLVASPADGTSFPSFGAAFTVAEAGGQPPRFIVYPALDNPPPAIVGRR